MTTIVSTRKHWKSLTAILVTGLTLPACDILNVNNPNSLTEESIESPSAATAVVNGAVAANARGIATQWLGYLIASDEITWIGSRDAWGQLDQGFVSNPANEFTDAAFPVVAQARWMADRAVAIMDGHVAETPTTAMKTDQARAYLHAGLIYLIIGETQEDFAFSDKQEAAEAVGPGQMNTVLDQAIDRLNQAVTFSQALNNAELINRSLALRARAYHSRDLGQDQAHRERTAAGQLGSGNGRCECGNRAGTRDLALSDGVQLLHAEQLHGERDQQPR